MTNTWNLMVGLTMTFLACSSEAAPHQQAGRVFEPLSDFRLLAARTTTSSNRAKRGGIKNRVPDSKILYDVQALLISLGYPHLEVEVDAQHVGIRGVVPTGSDVDHIERAVRELWGVAALDVELRVP